MFNRLSQTGKYIGQTLRLMVGQPDYPTYLAHMQENHPDIEPMTYEEFFVERMNARYGTGRGGCC